MRPEQTWRDRLVSFVRGSRLLVHDTTYTAEEYERHRGWGHSTYDEAVQLALDAGVSQLILFHHSPDRTDDRVSMALALPIGRGRRDGVGSPNCPVIGRVRRIVVRTL
jgi:ribonuclease BN (tRNA processing enzyme)